MTTDTATSPATSPVASAMQSLGPRAEVVAVPLAALVGGVAVFSLFLLFLGKSPVDFFALVYKAGFSTAFSWQNTLSRVAPLLLAFLLFAWSMVVLLRQSLALSSSAARARSHWAGWPLQ